MNAQLRGAVRIGVDESGKGDVFGPLVITAVAVTNEAEATLLSHGVRDSKTLSKSRIYKLAELIKTLCSVEVLVLQPSDYNVTYEEFGRNLNRLLAWGHAQVISRLEQRTQAIEIISDQFGDPSLLEEYLEGSNISVPVLQRPHAESDVAVAAASIVARAEFLSAITAYSAQLGMEVPLGASEKAKQAVKNIYLQRGMDVLRTIAKLHFRTVTEVLKEVSNG